MAEKRQKTPDVIGEKKGLPVYRANPSVPEPSTISKRKKVHYGNEQKGFVLDSGSGEVLNVGGAGFYEFEEVDDTRFVKMFLRGIKQAANLTKSGLTVFEVVYNQVQAHPSTDEVKLSYFTAAEEVEGLTERTYQRGVRELLKKGFLFNSPVDGVYFVNITYMFNGDRLAFVKGYKRKGSSVQGQLPLHDEEQEEQS